MDLAHYRMLNNGSKNKDPYVFPEQSPLIILDIKSDICMENNGKDTKQARHIYRRTYFVRNGEE